MSLKIILNKGFTSNLINIAKNSKQFHGFNQLRTLSSKRDDALDLSGIFPAIPTPFNSDETIAFDKLELNFKKWSEIPFTGYVIGGSTGEFVSLSSEEKINFIKASRAFIGKEKLLIAGSGCESTIETIKMTAKMAEVGADAVLVVTPSYYKSAMTNAALISHYEEVAKHSPVPVILYNVPVFTNVDISVDAIARLAQHKNIIGMKESLDSITKVTTILHRTKDQGFQVLVGSAGFLLPSLYMGAVGSICTLANVLGKELCDLCELYKEGAQATKEAILLQRNLIPPNVAVTRTYGIAGLKEMMDAQGYYGGRTRNPLQKLKKEESEQIATIFKNFG